MLKAAIDWRKHGIATIPIIKGSKKPAVKWKQYQTELPTLPQLIQWHKNNQYNLAVICGWQNLTILDFDTLPAYCRFVYENPEFKNTYTIKTARGRHVYVYCQDGCTRMQDDIDVKANGYCLTYPSVHPSGVVYSVEVDKDIMSVDALSDMLSPPITGKCSSSVVINNYGHIETLSVNAADTTNCNRWTVDATNRYQHRSDIVGRIKYKLRISDLFEPVKVFSDGRAFAHCPTNAHPNNDRDPSLALDLKTDRCYCISRSNCPLHRETGLDQIDAYAVLHNLTLKEAIRELAEKHYPNE